MSNFLRSFFLRNNEIDNWDAFLFNGSIVQGIEQPRGFGTGGATSYNFPKP